MTKLNNEWVPELNQECMVFNSAIDSPEWEKCIVLFRGEHITVYSSESCIERHARNSDVAFRAIKTEAEKRRETNTQELCNSLTCFYQEADCATPYEAANHRLACLR